MLAFTGKFWSSLTVIAIAAWQSAAAISARRRLGNRKPRGESNALRVLCLHRDLASYGGVPRCLLYLARASDPSHLDIRVASFVEPSEEMASEFAQIGIQPACLGDRGYFKPSRRLRHIVEEQNIDVVVVTTFKSFLCAKIALRGRAKTVFWLHAICGVMNGAIRKKLFAYLSRNDPLLFISQAVRKAHLPAGHLGPEAVIYDGVEDVSDPPAYGREMRQVLSLPDDAIVLAYVAEFVDCKDHPTAIAAVESLGRRGINAHLLLIGVGENMQRIRTLGTMHGVSDRVHFLGVRSDVRQLLGIVDIYIHPGRDEGFGLAVVEAMLAARPVIAANSGGIAEIIEDEKTGLLFDPRDPADLTRKIIALAQDFQRACGLGNAARKVCLERFTPGRFADEMTRYLHEVAAAERPIIVTPHLIS
jgi:glycosyltransferase involved in cell wall biosynthesis